MILDHILILLFLNMKGRNNFIPGIYNWCDRWCGRCVQTDKCRAFYMEQKRSDQEKDWLDEVQDDFSEMMLMLEKFADETGFNLEANQEEEEFYNAVEEAQEILIDNNPLIGLAETYWKKGKAWIESDLLMGQLEYWKLLLDNKAMDSRDFESNLHLVREAMEVVQWYLFFIPGKINRALHDQMDDFWDEFPDEERADLGSAKIAALAIDRSLEAWRIFQKFFSEDEQLSEIIVLLRKLQNGIIEVFPNYPTFIRPGFDDVE